MADQNITELPVKTSSGITSSDYMLGIDSAEGYQMLIRDLGDYIIRNVQVNTIAGANQTLKAALDTLNSKYLDNAGAHNAIYRGKYLGASVTEAQWSAISSGTFTDLYIGDYWTINGVNWRIAAFDYWLNCGDTNTTAHHVVIVPDTNLHSAKMNETNITTGAYLGSDFYTGNNDNTGRADAITKVNNAFGSSHILSHREYMQNATSNGYASGGIWMDATVELMTERMVCGNAFYENVLNGTNFPNSYSVDKSQLPLFAHEPSRITNRGHWWLRSVASSANFSVVHYYGYADSSGASYSLGVRPAFGIK